MVCISNIFTNQHVILPDKERERMTDIAGVKYGSAYILGSDEM